MNNHKKKLKIEKNEKNKTKNNLMYFYFFQTLIY